LARLGRLAVDLDEAGIDEFLDAGAGKFRSVCGDKAIKARAGVGGRGKKFDRVGGHAAIVAGDEEAASDPSYRPLGVDERRVPEWE